MMGFKYKVSVDGGRAVGGTIHSEKDCFACITATNMILGNLPILDALRIDGEDEKNVYLFSSSIDQF